MGRLLDSLSFNLPQQQEVVTSDPSKAPGQEYVQSFLAQGQAESRRMAQFRDLVGGAAGLGFQVLKPLVAKEREEKERAGRVYGLENLQGIGDLSGSYEQKSLQLRERFRSLRNNEEINLIDDPYFQKGLDTAYGITSIKQYDQAAGALYEKLSSAPDFYNNPDKFETEWRRLFDAFYVSLPENTVLQEAFLSKAGPIQDKYLQAYKAASNEWYRKEFVQQKQESLLAAEFVFKQTVDSFDSLNANDITEQYTNFSIELINGLDNGTITPEQIKAYTGFDAETGEELYSKLQDVFNTNDPEQALRSFLKRAATVDLIEDVRNVYDEFYNFAGQGRGALDIDPSDLIITTLTNSFEDPQTAIDVLNGLPSGTGMLKDTEKGQAGLNILIQKQEKYATQQRQKELSEYRSSAQAFGRRAAMELADLEAKISTFGDILAIEAQKGSPISPTELYQQLLAEAETLYTDPVTGELYDEEGFANVVGNLKTVLNKATSLSNSQMRKQEVEGVFNEVMGITNSESDIEDRTVGSVALGLVQMNNSEPSLTSDLLQSRTGTLHNQYLTNPEDESAQSAFWNHVRVLKNYNGMNAGSSDVRVSPSYSSKDLLVENPGLIQTMIIADSDYDALDVFVSPNTEIYDAIKAIGQPYLELGGDPARLGETLQAQLERFETDRQKKAEKQAELAREAEIKDRLGFSLDSIPLPGDKGVVRGGVRDLLKNLAGIGSVNPTQYPTEVLGFFADAYGQEYKKLTNPGAEGGYSSAEAAKIALRKFKERFKVVSVSDDIKMIVDSEQKMGDLPVPQYWESLEPDEDARHNVIKGFVDDLRFMTNNKSSQTAIAWLADFKQRTEKKLEESAMRGFDAEYKTKYIDTRPSLERSQIDSLFEEMRSSDQDPYLVKVVGDAIQGYFSQTMDLESFSAFKPMTEEMLNGLSQRVMNSLEANSDYVGYKPTTITEARELLFRLDPNDKLGIQVFNPRFKEARKKEQRDAIRAELTGEGMLESILTRQFGPEVARIYTQQEAFISNTAIFDLDDTNFDWDTDEYMLLPTGDGRFYIKDQEGDTLKYKATGALYTFSPQDLGDRMIDGGFFTYPDLWKDVRDSIDPKIPISQMTSRDEFMGVVGPYFDEWPRNLGLPYFNAKFGPRAYPMYKIYREVKGMRTFRQEDQPPSMGTRLKMLLEATKLAGEYYF